MQINNKRKLIFVGCIIFLVMIFFFYYINFTTRHYSGIGLGQMYIEEKHDDIKHGSLRMWFVGYNAAEKPVNRKRYKVYVEDAMVYNLLEVGKTYAVNADSTRKDKYYGFVYKLIQISNQEKYQLVGTGATK